MIKYINSEDEFKKEVLESKNLVVVDFFATWCGPCNMLAPVLENIANTRSDFEIAKIDIDKLRDLAIDQGIEVVPTLLIFKNGKVVGNIVGFVPEDEILKKIDSVK